MKILFAVEMVREIVREIVREMVREMVRLVASGGERWRELL